MFKVFNYNGIVHLFINLYFFVVNCTSTDLSIFFYFFTLFFHIVKYSSYCFVHYFCINKAMAKKNPVSKNAHAQSIWL